MKIAVIGAGPGGLFFAILLKSRIPSADIHVYEQNPCGATYGFGIGLAESAIHKLTAKDASTVNQLRARMIFLNRQVIENCAGEFCLELREEVGTITRLELLQVLLGRCESLSIPVRHEHRIESLSSMAGADLIVGADGANSLVRRSDEAGFGTRYDLRPNRFAWFGVRHGSRQSALRFRRVNREGKAGLLIAHYYSYTPEMWTFLPEVPCQGHQHQIQPIYHLPMHRSEPRDQQFLHAPY